MIQLKNKHIRSTPFREVVLTVFNDASYALSLQNIEEKIGEHDRITLYRTLKTFKDNGVIHEIALPNEPVKYALCETSCSTDNHEHNHIHFKCNSCNEIYCKEIKSIPQLAIKGFQIDEIEIAAKGICENCTN